MHHMLVTLIPQLTKHIVLLIPVALHLRAICQLLVITDGIANGACHITCVSFMGRALGEELWKSEVQIHYVTYYVYCYYHYHYYWW